MKRLLTMSLVAGALLMCTNTMPSSARADSYQSPYSLTFDYPLPELLRPNEQHPRNNPHLESKTPFDQWYTRETRRRFGAWGPEPRHYPGVEEHRDLAWKRQRVLAVAGELIGLPYQHHHLPDWDPPAGWPWKQVAYGHNSKGMDCSDFTSWCYNYGLGIHLHTGIRQQANQQEADGPNGADIPVKQIHDNSGYDALIKNLRAGDLLYIKRKNSSEISHVIMWLGLHGKSPDGTPLVIDCTGPEHTDCNGNRIPIGVQIRPFAKSSWYYQSFAHANRILHD